MMENAEENNLLIHYTYLKPNHKMKNKNICENLTFQARDVKKPSEEVVAESERKKTKLTNVLLSAQVFFMFANLEKSYEFHRKYTF